MRSISETLQAFGITRCYKGFDHTVYALTLVTEDEFRLQSVIRSVYQETAVHFDCSWFCVERDIRTVVARAWMINPSLLIKMAGYPLENAPTISEFLAIFASYLLRSGRKEPVTRK